MALALPLSGRCLGFLGGAHQPLSPPRLVSASVGTRTTTAMMEEGMKQGSWTGWGATSGRCLSGGDGGTFDFRVFWGFWVFGNVP